VSNQSNERPEGFRFFLFVIAGIMLILVLLFAVIFGLWAGAKGFSRYQTRADANNRVKVSSIEIRNQAQRILVTQQQAEIRKQAAVGIREAQDEIAKTLTPLYVQFEMVEALKQIAQSGSNNSVVFIPAGANGIPLISDATGPRVGGAQK
jgi:glucose-6-phosphate-specific signal transduction histidine kinase